MSSQRDRQSGWVASFVIVGVILAAILVGSVYFVKSHQNKQVATNEKPTVVTEDSNKDSSQAPATTNENNSPSQQSPATDQTTKNPASTDNSSDHQSSKSNQLPHTGPRETALSLLIVSIVAFAAASYVRSRAQA